jgi:polyisoprenyl-phosphate glycosyltransferase
MTRTIALVTPVLDDWVSLAALLSEISDIFSSTPVAFQIYAIDDGSHNSFDPAAFMLPAHSCVGSIEVIRLVANLGHQRAIAAGLCVVVEDGTADAVLIMDSDGQDRPADIAALLAAATRCPRHVVLAARARRSEPLVFRLGYRLYRAIFRALTGQPVKFGNFCVVPIEAARRLVYMPELWNHLAAAVMRSRTPHVVVPTLRSVRLCGRSQMSFAGLIVHGLSAMSVYSDLIFARALFAIGLAAAALGAIIAALIIVGASGAAPLATWAWVAAGGLLAVVAQSGVITIALALAALAGRSYRPIVPIADYRVFVAERHPGRQERHKPVIAAARPAA